jgi:regulator of ribonuclease activity A
MLQPRPDPGAVLFQSLETRDGMRECKTADLSDSLGTSVQVCAPWFRDFGGRRAFDGPIATVRCFEDNSMVRELLSQSGDGRVLVVDAGGSQRCAMLGDQLAQKAVYNGWAGVLMYGYIRDSADIARMPLGVKALGALPVKSVKKGVGETQVPVSFAGVEFRPGDILFADPDGVVVMAQEMASVNRCG